MFRAARCSSSGGQIVSPQSVVSSPSVNSRTVCKWRADCSPFSLRLFEWRYQRLWWYNLSFWGWARYCSKHVEDYNVILYCYRIKEVCIKLVTWKKLFVRLHLLWWRATNRHYHHYHHHLPSRGRSWETCFSLQIDIPSEMQ